MKNPISNQVLSFLVILLVIFNLGFLVIFWIKSTPHVLPPLRGGDNFLIKELNLREDQKKSYLKLKKDFGDSINEAKEATRKAKDHFFDLLKQENLDPIKVHEQAEDASKKEIFLDELTFRHFRLIRSLLDTNQKQKFDEIIQLAIHAEGSPPPPRGKPRDFGSGTDLNPSSPLPPPSQGNQGEQPPPPPRPEN